LKERGSIGFKGASPLQTSPFAFDVRRAYSIRSLRGAGAPLKINPPLPLDKGKGIKGIGFLR